MCKQGVDSCAAAHKVLLFTLTLAQCAVLVSCIGATPLPKRTRTPEGTEIKSVDLAFIHPGQTTRAEIKDKLRLIDTGYQGDRYFLGRWSSSTWGGWIIVAGMCCEAAGTAGRVWKTGNLLVEFDDAGTVKRSEPFNDRNAEHLLISVAENTPLVLDPPLEMSVTYLQPTGLRGPAKIALSRENLNFEDLSGRKKAYKFSIPVEDLVTVDKPLVLAGTDPSYVGWRIRCAHDLRKVGGPRGKDLNLLATLPQAVSLMSYVRHVTTTTNGASTEKK